MREDVVYSGPLYKLSRFGRWRLRHFKLDASHRLSYYSERKKRMVFVGAVRSVRLAKRRRRREPFCLDIGGGKVVRARTKGDLDAWPQRRRLEEKKKSFAYEPERRRRRRLVDVLCQSSCDLLSSSHRMFCCPLTFAIVS
mmetsp:Transcript_18571/g.59971  ORF Transcript_18571/g.59971 Transcript_18571/m.59971 type:complete len:140 (-) Transcript_18571:1656-2075(-)